ncbi:Chemotaxis protein methyltransferase CheR [Desulfovibrio sp. DV]|uniref:PocR ligand-binding domain-containing protein n=1 Tax=Desulfovibrio sp. DV TaxID=1844708 RepID=UPI00095BE197|nr:PocR ligand-binding domain-containing protein [Desulfovibrio sp. DV]OLN28857.1 Chemotaxis protein methyltransferase CheR [Desulfovibrio sp. DV]
MGSRDHSQIDTVLDPDEGVGTLELQDIVDIHALQLLMDHFQKLTGMVFAILDLKGTVLVAAGWQDICLRFHRVHPETAKRCRESDTLLTQGVEPGKFKLYHCQNNMWDVATPLIIGGRHMGNLFMGQFLFKDEEPDRKLFQDQARLYGFDEDAYLAALDRVPRWSRETLDNVMHFYSHLADLIAKLSYGNIKLARAMVEKSQLIEMLERSKEKTELANRTKSEFLANMSHEVRTPLNGILGMLQLLNTTSPTEEQKEYIVNGIQSTKRLTRLLSDILDISKIEAGRMHIVETEFDVYKTKKSILDIFSVEAQKKGIQLKFSHDTGSSLTLIGDEARLRQILFNLVGNSIKFTDAGEVNVNTTVLPVAKGSVVRVLVTVSDTGIGISDENLKRIFEPFVQAEDSYTRRFQGAGLGLSIVRRLMELLGGTITIDSTVGRGTTFYLTLPFKVPEGLPLEPVPPAKNHSGEPLSLRILFAEDDAVSLLTGRRILEKFGHTVVMARDGQEALQRLSEQEIDLILMDIQMPRMDGVEATKTIRESASLHHKSRIPIIAMTAYAMTGDREKFLAAGMDAYIAKPMDQDSLLAIVNQVMESRVIATHGK